MACCSSHFRTLTNRVRIVLVSLRPSAMMLSVIERWLSGCVCEKCKKRNACFGAPDLKLPQCQDK